MKKAAHSWKGYILIEDIEYYWEQFSTKEPAIIIVHVIKPIQLQFEFEPQKTNLGKAITTAIQLLKH